MEWTGVWTGKPAIIETDCSTIINDLASEPGTRAQWDGVLCDIRASCTLLPEFKFHAVKRS
jgi:hypothetical protein